MPSCSRSNWRNALPRVLGRPSGAGVRPRPDIYHNPKSGSWGDCPPRPNRRNLAGCRTQNQSLVAHLQGEQPTVEVRSAIADTFAGRTHVEWDATASVTPFGQLPFFIDYLKQAGLFDAWVADCPLSFTSPNAPRLPFHALRARNLGQARRRSVTCSAPCCCRCWPAIAATRTSPRCAVTR
jgi:hypothetical protein